MVERRAVADECTVQAYGSAAAIASVFGGKQSKALQKFVRALRPIETDEAPRDVGPSAPKGQPRGHSIDVLKARVRAAVAAGEL